MSTLIAVVLVVLVVAGGLTPALAGELEARQRAARDATWVATRAKFEANQASWARDRAQDSQDSAWRRYTENMGLASLYHWERCRVNTEASALASQDASWEATKAETKAKEAWDRATLKAVVMEALRGLKG